MRSHLRLAISLFVATFGSHLAGCKLPPGALAPRVSVATQPAVEDPMTRVGTLIPAPDDFARIRIRTDDYPIPPYAQYLQGVKICLDPGHGGDAPKRAFKRGPTGVREAEVNLRVAMYLRDCLEAVGAQVLLTRTDDVDLSLAERAEVANRWGADLFISCHHNAIDNKPQVNRTSVWFHNDVDYRPSDLDLARYLCQGLMQTLPFSQVSGVPLNSDQLMYATGFGVLAQADVTAALVESSFFTNPEEEQRLRTPEHNLNEAYGMFLGLARYVYAGLPRLTLTGPADGRVIPGETTTVTFVLDDGLRSRKAWGSERQAILTSSLDVRLDGQRIPFRFRNEGYVLEADLPPDLAPGGHRVDVQFANMFKNSVLNPHAWIDGVAPVNDATSYELSIETATDPWLQRRLVEIDRAICSELGLAWEQRACGLLDLTRGRLAMIRPDEMFYGASVPKIAILLAYFQTHPQAAHSLSSQVEQELGLMIKRSDNALAARYSQELGLATIRDVLVSDPYRFYDPDHGGGLWSGKHYSKEGERLPDPVKGLSHAVTVRQALRYYRMLDQGRLVSPEASAAMKRIFASPSLDHLPTYFVKALEGRDVSLLRKSGTWENFFHDTALVEHPEGARYVLVGLTEHPRGAEYLERLACAVDDLLTQ